MCSKTAKRKTPFISKRRNYPLLTVHGPVLRPQTSRRLQADQLTTPRHVSTFVIDCCAERRVWPALRSSGSVGLLMSSSTFSCVMVLVPQLHLNDSLRGVYVRLMMASPCSWPWSYQAVRARLTTPGAPALTAACTQLAHASWSSWDRQRARSAGAWRPWSSSRRSCRSPSCRTVCMMWVVDVQRAGSAAQRSSSSVKRGEGPSCGVCVDAYPCFFGGMAMGSARGGNKRHRVGAASVRQIVCIG